MDIVHCGSYVSKIVVPFLEVPFLEVPDLARIGWHPHGESGAAVLRHQGEGGSTFPGVNASG